MNGIERESNKSSPENTSEMDYDCKLTLTTYIHLISIYMTSSSGKKLSTKIPLIVISNAGYYRCMHRESSSDSNELYDREPACWKQGNDG